MQSCRSRPGSSEMQPKITPSAPYSRRSLSPSIRKSSPVSSNSVDYRASKVSERKPVQKAQSFFQEKQRPVRVSEMQEQWGQLQEDLRKTKEERFIALEELEELKKSKDEESLQTKDRIKMLEFEAEKAKESEGQMLESLFSQTKQLEQTKILLEEAKLEIRNLPNLRSQNSENNEFLSSSSIHAIEEIGKLRNELRLALQAEEKSKKAMDDLAMALKEVTNEATMAKSELSATESELEKVRAEAENFNKSLLQSTDQKLRDVLMEYQNLKLEYEESTAAWKEKEDSFMNCIKISEEDMKKKDQAHRMAREETSKLRDIIKQAVNEATVIKESLEIARYQNYELEEQLSKKENVLQQIKHDYESIKVSEAAALDSVRELKSLLASVSAADSKKASAFSEFESSKQSNATMDDRKISKSGRNFSSDRWTKMKPVVQNGQRHSVGELDMFNGLALEKERSKGNKDGSVSNAPDFGLPSFLFNDDKGLNTDDFDHLHGILFSDTETEKKKKKTALRRFGDVLMRRSVRKP